MRHIPVLLEETTALLEPERGRVFFVSQDGLLRELSLRRQPHALDVDPPSLRDVQSLGRQQHAQPDLGRQLRLGQVAPGSPELGRLA